MSNTVAHRAKGKEIKGIVAVEFIVSIYQVMLKGMAVQHGFQSTSACKEATSAASLGGIIKIFLLLKLSKASGGRACFLLNSNSERQYTVQHQLMCTERLCSRHTYLVYLLLSAELRSYIDSIH